jgi:hypothetical protein
MGFPPFVSECIVILVNGPTKKTQSILPLLHPILPPNHCACLLVNRSSAAFRIDRHETRCSALLTELYFPELPSATVPPYTKAIKRAGEVYGGIPVGLTWRQPFCFDVVSYTRRKYAALKPSVESVRSTLNTRQRRRGSRYAPQTSQKAGLVPQNETANQPPLTSHAQKPGEIDHSEQTFFGETTTTRTAALTIGVMISQSATSRRSDSIKLA